MSHINFTKAEVHNIPQSWMTRSVVKAARYYYDICYIGIYGGIHTGRCTFEDGVVTTCII